MTGLMAWAVASAALAEAPVLSAHSRVEGSRVGLLLAPHGVGAGVVLAQEGEAPVTLSAEALYIPGTGVAEVRGAWQRRLTGEGLFSASVQVGLVGYGVLRGPADVGLGPHVGLFAGLGGSHLEGFLGAQAGAEYFLRTGGPRLPVRGLLGLRGRLGNVGLGLVLRGGQDFEPGLSPTWRGEALLSLCWHGLGAR
jgi:hypothetical protein